MAARAASVYSNSVDAAASAPIRRLMRSPDRPLLPVEKVCRVLEASYGSPRHGNKSNPLDELVYIILSTRTGDRSVRTAYWGLKGVFPSWNRIGPEDVHVLTSILAPAGLGRLKARQIAAIMERLRTEFGRATLAPLKSMTDEEAEAFLTTLPGVGRKVAKCVLMYSLGRELLPVDTHVYRVARRLGFQVKKRADSSQDLLEAAVPRELRYGFHVNAVAHGRAVCVPRTPRCRVCCISSWCQYDAAKRKEN